jgi:type I restriction enzyme S subunit
MTAAVGETTKRRPLGELLRRPPRYGINAAAVSLAPGVPSYIRITDIDDEGRFSPSPKVGVRHPKSADYVLHAGELVFARTGASVGKSYLYDAHDGELVFAGFLINIAPDARILNPKYLSLVTRTQDYWDWVARTSARSGQPGINGREYAQLPVPLPDIATQDAIAHVMSDVDGLIDRLERLIAKKQAIKHGMMQQLLTGMTRMPGFNEPWKHVTLGEIAEVSRGASPRPIASPRWFDESSSVGWVRISDVSRSDGLTLMNTTQRLSPDGIVRSRFLPAGTLIMSIAATVGVPIITGIDTCIHDGFVAIERLRGIDQMYLLYALKSLEGELRSAGQTGSQANVNTDIVKGIGIDLPSVAEQLQIGGALRDMDLELRSLRHRFDKTQAIKRGMIQQLLTGRTRLPIGKTVS